MPKLESPHGRGAALKVVSHASRRASLLALLVVCASTAMARGQGAQETPASGRQSLTDQYSDACTKNEQPNFWKQLGVDPLTCHPESAPQDSSKQCSLSGMKLVAHISETCYYCAANNPPVVLRVPMDQVELASRQNFSCGEDPTDNCFALCSSEGAVGLYIPPSSQPSGGNQSSQSQPAPSGTPCEPNYDMSTPAGRAAAQANAAQTMAACNAYRCQHNPELAVCSTLTLKGSVQATNVIPSPPQGSSKTPPANDPFANQMLADAQSILLSAGKISKEMTDSMDVTKHNNVGIGVIVGSYFGAAGKMMGVVANSYKLLAAASSTVAAAQKAPLLQIAKVAATESETLAGQAATTASKLEQTGEAAGATGGASMGAPWGSGANYLEDAVIQQTAVGCRRRMWL